MNKKVYESRALQLFFDDPEGVYHIREIARQTKLHPNMVLRDVALLKKEGLLITRETRAVVEVRANRENPLFIALKRINNIRALYLLGLVDEINKAYSAPEAIVLFGSYSRGEDTKKSDVDIAVITKRQISFNTIKYSRMLKREIQILETDLQTASKDFITNLANGIILKGYLNL